MPLTVSEIAERIAGVGDNAALIERLRHWTREGLLTSLGERNPGTGHHRLYDDSAMFDAAVLNALSNQGVHIGKQRHFVVVMQLLHRARELWDKRTAHSAKMLFLEIMDFGDPNPQGITHAVELHEGSGRLINPRSNVSIVLNLSRLFKQLEKRSG